MAPTLTVETATVMPLAARPPPPRCARSSTPCSMSDANQAMLRSFVVERAFILDMLDEESAGTWAIKPLATRTKLRWLDGFDLLTRPPPSRTLHARPLLPTSGR